VQYALGAHRHLPALHCPPCSERKNVNLPGVVVDLPTLTEKDINDIVNWCIPNDIDFIAASFVRKASDIENVRKVRECVCTRVCVPCTPDMRSTG